MTKTSKYISRVYLTIIFGILYIPIITLIFFSFNASNSTAVFTGFSLRWYRELFRSPDTFACPTSFSPSCPVSRGSASH